MDPTVGRFLLFFLSLPLAWYINWTPIVQEGLARILPAGVDDNAKFDFIVVGAGSAGCVVARRLVEAGHEVLLIEAGGPANFLMAIPGLVTSFQLTSYDWQYKTVPQDTLAYSVANWPRGKVLGGSSQLNYMVYVRGHPRDFDEWADLGNPGWSYKDVLPFFKKSQNYYEGPADPEYTGKDGPMHVKTSSDDDIAPLSHVHEEALKEIGYNQADYNGKDQAGIYRAQINVDHGWRADSYRSFAAPMVGNGLTVLTYAHVTNLVFKPGTKQVHGVQVSRFGKELNLFAKKEVIVAGGAVNSPQLLMLSGIGPKEHLEDHGIKVQVDLPGVGLNLQDHLHTVNGLNINRKPNPGPRLSRSNFEGINPMNYINFFLNGKGPLTDSGVPVGAFVTTAVNEDPYKRPDIQMITLPFGIDMDYGLVYRNVIAATDELFDGLVGNDLGG